ncbi:MAG: LysR substrate-binding domain-containing protein [Pusillimonas sp.]|nr:LysR substrate-binding domain-containing protein [Pusillimonas sp.]
MSHTNGKPTPVPISGALLYALRAFDAAARHSSFTRAAKELHVTQGAVSQQVRFLEERIGVPMFKRGSRGLTLTAEGGQLAAATAAALQGIAEALAAFAESTERLVISCPPSFAALWLIPRLGDFSRGHPAVQLHIRAEFHALNDAAMRGDAIDLGIRYDQGAATDLLSDDIMDEYLLPVASPLFAGDVPWRAERLIHCPLLHDASPWDDAPPHIEWLDWLDQVQASLKTDSSLVSGHHAHEFNMSQLAIQAALDGQGVAMGRTALVWDYLQQGKLVDIFRSPVRATARYRVLTRRAGRDGQALQQFTAWLGQQCDRFDQARRETLGL